MAVAQYVPQMVEKLVVLSTPHPQGLIRELTYNKKQQNNSEYAKKFQEENSYKNLLPDSLANWVKDESAIPHYIEAFKNSRIKAMLNYYKASFPKQPKTNSIEKKTQTKVKQIKIFHAQPWEYSAKKIKLYFLRDGMIHGTGLITIFHWLLFRMQDTLFNRMRVSTLQKQY